MKPEAASMKTMAVFFPFDLFGSAGAGAGAELLAEAFQEILADNKREKIATRARAYQGQVRTEELSFETLDALQTWRARGRCAARQALEKKHFLLWVAGNHLGVLPVYDELATGSPETVVIQLDAHLDVYNLTDCTAEMSHGNFLLHCDGSLPPVINVGHRELLLRPDYIRRFYRDAFAAADLFIDPEPALKRVREACDVAERVFIDIDCDVFDPVYLPAVSHPSPFGLDPRLILRFIDAAWSNKVAGIALSEFDPSRDRDDRSLATLIWLLELLLLKRYEPTDAVTPSLPLTSPRAPRSATPRPSARPSG